MRSAFEILTNSILPKHLFFEAVFVIILAAMINYENDTNDTHELAIVKSLLHFSEFYTLGEDLGCILRRILGLKGVSYCAPGTGSRKSGLRFPSRNQTFCARRCQTERDTQNASYRTMVHDIVTNMIRAGIACVIQFASLAATSTPRQHLCDCNCV